MRRTCWGAPTGILSSWRWWSLMTSRGCTDITWKPRSSHHNGSI
jgi:hypothetical protein